MYFCFVLVFVADCFYRHLWLTSKLAEFGEILRCVQVSGGSVPIPVHATLRHRKPLIICRGAFIFVVA